ncbi:hypothetical protein ACFPRL_26920 [Pseudoclavibacter helvolus]
MRDRPFLFGHGPDLERVPHLCAHVALGDPLQHVQPGVEHFERFEEDRLVRVPVDRDGRRDELAVHFAQRGSLTPEQPRNAVDGSGRDGPPADDALRPLRVAPLGDRLAPQAQGLEGDFGGDLHGWFVHDGDARTDHRQ